MQFQDKLTPTGQPEKYSNGEATDRFVMIAASREEALAVRGALTNLAEMVMQSDVSLDPEDAKTLIDYLKLDKRQQERLTVNAEQAERLARLIQQGGTTVTHSSINNQFEPRANERFAHISEDELGRLAIGASTAVRQETSVRQFRTLLQNTDDIFGVSE